MLISLILYTALCKSTVSARRLLYSARHVSVTMWQATTSTDFDRRLIQYGTSTATHQKEQCCNAQCMGDSGSYGLLRPCTVLVAEYVQGIGN